MEGDKKAKPKRFDFKIISLGKKEGGDCKDPKDTTKDKKAQAHDDKQNVETTAVVGSPIQSEHRLPIVAYNNLKQKYRGYHSREYGVYYNRNFEAYHYRGYDIKAPEVKTEFPQPCEVKNLTRWVQYMSHVEEHPRKQPYMYYSAADNSFIQVVLILYIISLLFTLIWCVVAKLIKSTPNLLLYDLIWVPGVFGMLATIYTMLCSPCARKFPLNYIMLILNVISMTYMCCYVTVYHNTFLIIFALVCINVIALIFLLMALCDVDFTKFAVFCLSILLGLLIPYIFFKIFGSIKTTKDWVPTLDRRYNMMLFGIMTYSMSAILMLQLIIQNRTVLLHDDDYASGSFLVYMCVVALFMKLVSYMGLFEENHY